MADTSTVDAPSAFPVRKVAAGGIGSLVAIIVIWILSLFNITMPLPVAGAIVGIVNFIVSYFVPSAANEEVK